MQRDFLPVFESVWTVSLLNRWIRSLIDSDYRLQDLWLEGEVSNLTRASSGHLYFTLKDESAQVRCVMWRNHAVLQTELPRHGDRVQAHGSVGVYEAQGQYQFYVDHWRPTGRGDLHLQFERLKERLAAEGLFAPERKRVPVRVPRCIGVVTSLNTAALRDILNVLRRRWPLVEVVVAHALVQGDGAPAQICAALEALQRYGPCDTIIVARGGGSLEELWAFNDERVARAIAGCAVPVITGVGHEVDFTIADFAADVRAPTPSAAAELAVPDRAEYRLLVAAARARLDERVLDRVASARYHLGSQLRTLRLLSPRGRLDESRQRVDELSARARAALGRRLELWRVRLSGVAGRLEVLGPEPTLARGYAIVRHTDGRAPGSGQGRLVRSAGAVAAGDRLSVQVHDGSFEVTVDPAGRAADPG
jgi:exodeoxyribonuclease VII large subunit